MDRDSKRTPSLCSVAAALLTVIIAAACGDNGTTPPDLGDLTAFWAHSSTVIADGCGSSVGETNTDNIILIQCGNTVNIIARDGLWGNAVILNNQLTLTGNEIRTDEEECRSTRASTGLMTGSSSRLEGAFTTTVTYDPATCGVIPACTMESSVVLWSPIPYRSSCIGRDEFGNPSASEYVLPYPVGEAYKLNNSYCVPAGGHREQQAYDFLIPVGGPVVASRAGVVRKVKDDSPDDGQGTDHNHVMIEHADGTVGFYAHLQQGSAAVAVGESVEAGEIIANSGHSGTPDVAHLHFGVYDGYPPIEGQDQAINFRNADGPLDCRGGLVNGAVYTALNLTP
jgi:hypothetical protein